MTDVSIIIVNYNVKDLVDNCIASIYKSNNTNLNLEIFFVDNNSVDGSSEHISNLYPEVKIIQNKKNAGFSKANNVALRQAAGKYILILNPDTVLEESTFDKLIKFVESEENTGAVTSKLILGSGKLDVACRRSFPSVSVALPRILGLSKMFPKSKVFSKYNLTYLDENETAEVDAVCGAFMFIPKKVLDETGYFDEDYFMYGEDLDLCYRIKEKGYKIFYYPAVTTIHLKGESTKKTKFTYVNNFYGAMRIFVRKNYRNSSGLLLFFLQLGIIYRSSLSYLKRSVKVILPALIDIASLVLSFILAVFLRFQVLPNKPYRFIIIVYVIIWILVLTLYGVYIKKNRYLIFRTFSAIFIGLFINSSITYFFNEYAFSREVILTSTFWAVAFLLGWRSVVNVYRFFVGKNILLKKINLLVVSKKNLNEELEDKLDSKYNIMHFSGDEYSIEDLRETIIIKNINEIVFSGDLFSNSDILRLMWSFKDKNIKFKIVPSGNELFLSKLRGDIDNPSLIEIEYNINNKLNIFSKRLFDLLLSSVLIISVYPALKFYSFLFGKKDSRLIKKVSLLPYVWINKFSFVGVPVWYDDYNSEFLGKRGITGLLQLHCDSTLTKEDESNYLVYYAKNQSLQFDIEIILKTLITIFKK
ncbi:MAG: glycosyltransferase [Ignavibacteria bacterium]|nr:glycosyltransferase [Ignavibacteria bacterium]